MPSVDGVVSPYCLIKYFLKFVISSLGAQLGPAYCLDCVLVLFGENVCLSHLGLNGLTHLNVVCQHLIKSYVAVSRPCRLVEFYPSQQLALLSILRSCFISSWITLFS